jgi:hypothetical protein
MFEKTRRQRGDSNENKNGQQLAKEHLASLRAYIADLKQQEKGLPSRDGKPNFTAVAGACGFDRKLFYGPYRSNQEARQIINEAISNDIGLEEGQITCGEPSSSKKVSDLEKKLDAANRTSQRLGQDLVLAKEETNYWKRRAKDAEERLKQFSSFELMETTGRRFIP